MILPGPLPRHKGEGIEETIMKPKTIIEAQKAWARNPNTMVAFAPSTHPGAKVHGDDKWILADKDNIIGVGFSLDDMIEMKKRTHRRYR